jgi:hypothetical protein
MLEIDDKEPIIHVLVEDFDGYQSLVNISIESIPIIEKLFNRIRQLNDTEYEYLKKRMYDNRNRKTL